MRSSLVDGARQAIAVGIACAIVGVIIGVLTLTGAASNFAGFILRGRREEPVPVAVPDDDRLPDPRHGHSDDSELHHHQRDRRAGAAEARRAADRVAHVRLLFRHHGRPDAAGGAGGVRRGVDRQGVADADRLEGDAHRDRRLRHSVHGRLRPGADAATGSRRHGRIRRRGRYVVVKAVVAIGLWGGAAVGYFLRGPLSWPERIVAFAAASLLVAAIPWTDEAGFVASALFIAWHLWRTAARRRRRRLGVSVRAARRAVEPR